LREAMNETNPIPMGGEGKSVQADETYYGNSSKRAKGYRKAHRHKAGVVALVEPMGRVRAVHVKGGLGRFKQEMRTLLVTNVHRTSELHTDESPLYKEVGKEFSEHGRVAHQRGEYFRGPDIHTNTVEGYYSIFKRGMKGVYQHCGEKHLHRYLAEFDFRYSNRVALGVDDGERATRALKGVVGKRLTYRIP